MIQPLDLLYYRTGYKYQLDRPIRFVLPLEFGEHEIALPFLTLSGGVLMLLAGYAYDGPSGPTADSKCSMRAAALHDAGYQMIREGLLDRSLKEKFDSMFYELLLADGMGKIRAWLWYRAVKRLGHSATIRNRDILVAP